MAVSDPLDVDRLAIVRLPAQVGNFSRNRFGIKVEVKHQSALEIIWRNERGRGWIFVLMFFYQFRNIRVAFIPGNNIRRLAIFIPGVCVSPFGQ